MSYAAAKAVRDQLERDWRAASEALNALPGASTGPMGLTPDHVRATAAWQAAKAAYELRLASLQAFNRQFVKLYRADIRAERRARTIQAESKS